MFVFVILKPASIYNLNGWVVFATNFTFYVTKELDILKVNLNGNLGL